MTDTDAVLGAVDGAALLWVETPTNPLVGVAELDRLSEGAHAAGAVVAVDSTFATPLLQRPFELGADVVVHSATKFIGGHSDLLLGMAGTRDPQRAEALRHTRGTLGATPGALEAFLALRGLRTHGGAARARPGVSAGAGGAAGRAPGGHRRPLPGPAVRPLPRARRAADGRLRVDARVRGRRRRRGRPGGRRARPRARPRDEPRRGRVADRAPLALRGRGSPESLLRLSVGIEDVEDLWADLSAALGSG